MAAIYPSLMGANLTNIQEELVKLDPYCQGYHLDVMDGQFVPNITFGSSFVNQIAKSTYKRIWVQLLVEDPQAWLDKLFLPVESIVTFHIESKGEIIKTIDLIKEKNWAPSIAVNPKTNVDEIFTYLDMVSQALVMSVTPGFAGQEFLSSVTSKVDQLVGYRQTSGLKFDIAMDGGIDKNNIVMLKDHGVDDFAIASGIFKSDNPVEALKELHKLIS